MVRIRPFLSSVMALALLSAPLTSSAYAAEASNAPSVKVRGSDKGNYSRIVFDWGNAPSTDLKYTATQQADKIILNFAKGVDLVADGTAPTALSRITNYKIISPTQVEIDFSSGLDVRHFVTNNRLIVDVQGTAKEKPAATAAATSPTPAAPVNLADKIETAAGTDAKVDAKIDTKKEQDAQEKAIEQKLSNQKNVIVDQAPSEAGHNDATTKPEVAPKIYNISLTSTTAVPLAAFERNGYLWLVQGKGDVKLPPQIRSSSPQDKLGSFSPVPSPEGVSTFRIKMPDGFSVTSSGGALVWKLDLSDRAAKPSTEPLGFKRLADKANNKSSVGIIWPTNALNRVVDITDPDVGDIIKVGLVEMANAYTGAAQTFVDFDSLSAAVGVAAVPKADDLVVTKVDNGVLFNRKDGMNIAVDNDFLTAKDKEEKPKKIEPVSPNGVSRIFDFKEWQVGDRKSLSDNQRLIMQAMGNQNDVKKAEGLIGLAKLSLSFNYAPEAIGYLDLAKTFVPDIDTSPEYMALLGAADVMAWRPKAAYQLFSNAALNDVGEVAYWKAYTLAKLDDWQQAAKTLPEDVSIINSYTDDVKTPFALTLAEVALREGNIAKAKKLLDILEPLRKNMELPYASAYDYLTGEMARQTKKPDEAKDIWKKLTEGKDDLYRAKSRFALTMMQIDSKEITADKGVDNLEGLRYAWRGDDLEVSINYNLAKIYLLRKDPVKALTMMKLARSLNPSSEQGKQIDEEMHRVYKDLFTPGQIKNINPVDVLILYNEFANLIPPGAEGEELSRQLAERMANADLLPRAISLLKKQVDGDGLKGVDGVNVAVRLAALQTMDSKPDDALKTLDKAENMLKGLPVQDVLAKQQDIGLLRAKAYSLQGKPDDAFAALALLPQDDDSLKLRADIAWRGKKWQDAADSLEQLVQNQNITLTRPLSDEQADLLLNWAVALYLADNRYVLANLRERYSDAMAATTKAQKFEVVTRPRQGAMLADRETINSIIDETRIFKDFLTSFKASDGPPTGATAPTPVNNTGSSDPANIPEALRNTPGLKTDEVLGD